MPQPPAPVPRAAPLPPEFLAMMARGVSCIVASSSADLQPSIMRAVGTAVAAHRGEITVFLQRQQSHQLLQDIRDTGRLAVVFSEPPTHRTVKFKATRAVVRDARPSDRPALRRYLASMEQELGQIGFEAAFTRAMLAAREEDLVALSFVPEQSFDQTPGPKAGAALPAAGGSGEAA